MNEARASSFPISASISRDRRGSPPMEAGGGATLSEIYQSAQRLLLRATGGLERLERLDSSSSSTSFSYASSSSMPSIEDPEDLASAIKKDITQIRSLCAEMDRLWRSIPARGQRDLWRRYEI